MVALPKVPLSMLVPASRAATAQRQRGAQQDDRRFHVPPHRA